MDDKFFKSPKLTIVSPVSGNYERNRRADTVKADYFQDENVFGMTDLMGALAAGKQIKFEEDGTSFSLDDYFGKIELAQSPQVSSALNSIREQLAEKFRDIRYSGAIKEFFNGVMVNPILKPRLMAALSGSKVIDKSSVNKIPNDLLLDMLIVHASLYIKKTEEFKPREKILRKKFIKRLDQMVKNGVVDLKMPDMVNAINEFKVHLRDPLAQTLIETFGDTNSEHAIINLSFLLSPDIEEEVYDHEMFHAVSGGATILVSFPSMHKNVVDKSGLVKQEGKLMHVRSGLLFSSLDGEHHLHWLNEAATQDLTLTALEKKDGHAYIEEMELLNLLLTKGKFPISKTILYHSYFSRMESGEADEVGQSIKVFSDAVDQSYGVEGFLLKLDDYVQKHGLKDAIEIMKRDPKLF